MHVELHERPAVDGKSGKPVEVSEIHISADRKAEIERLEIFKHRMMGRKMQSAPCDPGKMILWLTREA